MSGEMDLQTLIKDMRPHLHPDEYVFATLPPEEAAGFTRMALGTFQEDEGTTLILKRKIAVEHQLSSSSVFRRITLTVHSSLDAVGFLAAVTNILAEGGISTNVISGYFHDHIFIPASTADQAMDILERFSTSV